MRFILEVHDSPLHYAVKQSRLDILTIIATNASSTKMDMNIEGVYDNSHLFHDSVLGEACFENQIDIIKFYMNLKGNQKVDFNKPAKECTTLFHQACVSGHIEVVRLFLQHADDLKIDLNAHDMDDGGMTPFMLTNSKEILELLLNDQRIDVNATDTIGFTALLWLYNGPGSRYTQELILELATFLLESPRIDPNVGDTSLLHIASNVDEAEVFFKAAMKRRTIDVNRRDVFDGVTPAHHAFGFSVGLENGFLDHYEPVQPPFTIKKFSPMIEVFLKYAKDLHIDFEATDNKGKTPLHYLYQVRSKELVDQFLVAAKNEYDIDFNLDAIDNDGKKPVELAM